MKVQFRAVAPLAAGFALLFTGSAMANGGGVVYTQTNSPTGNAVHRLDRGADGALTLVATYRTGGTGTGAVGHRGTGEEQGESRRERCHGAELDLHLGASWGVEFVVEP